MGPASVTRFSETANIAGLPGGVVLTGFHSLYLSTRVCYYSQAQMYPALFLSFLVPFVLAFDIDLATVREAFDTANIPTNLSLAFDPTVLLEVTFPQTNGSPVTLTAGVQLPRNSTAGPPIFSIAKQPSATCSTFVVAAVDLDAPTPQNRSLAEIRHFLGGNFHLLTKSRAPVRRLSKRPKTGLLSNSTPAISEFIQPTPPAGSDPHRYVFLLFEQPAGFDEKAASLVNSATPITNFNISAFAAEVGLGNPLGGTFMLVGPDPAA